MTEDEVSTMQRSVNNAYDNFVQYVSGRRQISVDEIKSHIGAMIYDEQQGMELHLVDQIGNKDEAYQQLADQINPGADFKVERLVAPHSLLERVLLSAESLSGQTAPSVSGCPLASSVLAFQGDVASLCRGNFTLRFCSKVFVELQLVPLLERFYATFVPPVEDSLALVCSLIWDIGRYRHGLFYGQVSSGRHSAWCGIGRYSNRPSASEAFQALVPGEPQEFLWKISNLSTIPIVASARF